MLQALAKIFGSSNDRTIHGMQRDVAAINALEPEIAALSDEQLRGKTDEFRARLARGEALDKLLVPAFAVVREAARRVLGMRHFDVQLIGGMVLHKGMIAEMRTGEGKTLVGTLPAYLNALTGKGVHLVTVNDYLAQRDSAWMGKVHQFLGLTVGVIVHGIDDAQRKAAYGCDITYGTNNEYGFDYLRDNMKYARDEMVQRPFNFAIVDEVDSILIDEARTPLIISGPTEDNSALYTKVDALIPKLQETHYEKDEKARNVSLNEDGVAFMEELLTEAGMLTAGSGLYDIENVAIVHHVQQALRAHKLFRRDTDYIVKGGKVIIIDEFTGRMMEGRRYSEGLHQALEAKEKVQIQNENQTLASITFQNYFRMYGKLAGMTGTADTEAYEFQQIYGLETVVIPTNLPMVRIDHNDQIFRTAEEKYEAVVADIQRCHEAGQPVLVGTTSIENSELVAKLLNQQGLPHNVLNAKEHEREALIVAQAGKAGMITVATNMAGRGTDIVLGGNVQHQSHAINADESLSEEEKARRIADLENGWEAEHEKVLAAGGLHIIGTERHESRRIDNQLRGRAGRQGDPGSSRFYLSFEDPLLRLFALDRAAAILNRLAPERGVAIEHGLLTRQIEGAQRKVEGRNFDMRKQVLEYDDVANDQRKVIYHQRNEILTSKEVTDLAKDIREDVVGDLVDLHMPPDSMEEQWDLPALEAQLAGEFRVHADIQGWLKAENTLDNQEVKARLIAQVEQEYAEKVAVVGEQTMSGFERNVMLQVIDSNWREHLAAMDYLRQGIHLRGYAQKNPKQEYKREAFAMFESLWSGIKHNIATLLTSVQIERNEDAVMEQTPVEMQAVHSGAPAMTDVLGESRTDLATEAFDPTGNDFSPETLAAQGRSVHRNDPCPCGSGLKYKHCHGKLS